MKDWIRELFNNMRTKPYVQIIKPPILVKQTQEIIKSIATFYDSDFITYWGAGNSSITFNDVIVFNEILKKENKSDKLYLFIKSPGGSGEVALRIIHLLRNFYKEIIVLAPIQCASAATMLALGADGIKMGPLSFLTAIDTSITHELSPVDVDNHLVSVNQNELDRVLKLWNKEAKIKDKNSYEQLYKYVHPLVFGAVDRASSLSIRLTNEILSYHMEDQNKINLISNHLNSEYPSHGYPITSKKAQEIGLKIESLEPDIHEQLIKLNHLYSEMAQRAYTDYDQYKYHDNQILKIIESEEVQIFYQMNKDMIWRKEDKQMVSYQDNSSWIKIKDGQKKRFFIR